MKNTIKGIMKDIYWYPLHKAEMETINSMTTLELIRYCCFCFGMASIGIWFLISQNIIG